MLFNWNGSSFIYDSISLTLPSNLQCLSIACASNNDTYFLFGNWITWRSFLVYKQNDSWKLLDSISPIRNDLWLSENGNLYETGELGFYKWNGNSWLNLLPELITTYGIAASSENNIFIVGTRSNNGLVYHYNGKDFHLYENLQLLNVSFYDAWTDGKEVFILGTNIFDTNSTLKTIILHGK